MGSHNRTGATYATRDRNARQRSNSAGYAKKRTLREHCRNLLWTTSMIRGMFSLCSRRLKTAAKTGSKLRNDPSHQHDPTLDDQESPPCAPI